jgi:hypothetical protein
VAALVGTADPIPKAICDRADSYIVAKVGRLYFEANYRLLLPRSYYSRHAETVEYFLYFEYAPATRLGLAQPVFVRLFNSPDYVPINPAAVVENGKIVEPSITLDEAIKRIGEQTGFPIEAHVARGHLDLWAPPAVPQEHRWKWRIDFVPKTGFPRNTEYLPYADVDAVTGQILQRPRN